MGRQAVLLYVLAMVAVVVGVDVLFFRHQILGAADSKRRNCPGIRGLLLQVPEEPMSRAAAMRLADGGGSPTREPDRRPDRGPELPS